MQAVKLLLQVLCNLLLTALTVQRGSRLKNNHIPTKLILCNIFAFPVKSIAVRYRLKYTFRLHFTKTLCAMIEKVVGMWKYGGVILKNSVATFESVMSVQKSFVNANTIVSKRPSVVGSFYANVIKYYFHFRFNWCKSPVKWIILISAAMIILALTQGVVYRIICL